jgi:hypothetical protein
MKKYVFIFSAAYFLLTALSAAFLAGKSGGAGVNLAIAIGSSFLAAAMFVKAHGRAPTNEEKTSYAWGSLLASCLISLILVLAFISYSFSSQQIAAFKVLFANSAFLITVGIALFIFGVIYYFAIKWSFSWYANRSAN